MNAVRIYDIQCVVTLIIMLGGIGVGSVGLSIGLVVLIDRGIDPIASLALVFLAALGVGTVTAALAMWAEKAIERRLR